MSTSTIPEPVRWNGWMRRGQRGQWWCVVRGAASDAEAMEQLRRTTATDRHVDLAVLRAGQHPADQRPR
jgi:hypothetical protein